MKSGTYIAILLSLLAPSTALAESLTLDSFLSELEAKHPFIQSQKKNTEISEQDQQAELGNKDWTLSAEAGINYNEPPGLGIVVPDSERATSVSYTHLTLPTICSV